MTPVKINILDKEYVIGCDDTEKASLESAADYLSEQMRVIRETGKVVGSERIAVMAALNITHELLQNNTGTSKFDASLPNRIAELLNSVNGALDPNT